MSGRRLSLAAALVLLVLAGCSRSGGSHAASPATTTTIGPTSTTAPAPSSSASTTVARTTTTLGRCATSALALRPNSGSAATGHALAVFELRNTSSAPCRLTGYPGVRLLDAGGATLADAQRTAGFILGDAPAATVTVAAGQAAYFGVESANVCQGGGNPVPSATLRVTPPDETASLTVPATINVCPGGTSVLVSPVRATIAEIPRH